VANAKTANSKSITNRNKDISMLTTSRRLGVASFIIATLFCALSNAQEPATQGGASTSKAAPNNWIALFDGATMDGWEKVGKDDSHWEVKDGALSGSGTQSMLVCTKGPYKNFKYRVEVKINDGGNSGVYFRTPLKPTSYELEVRDDIWRKRELTRIKVTVDGNELYEYLDFAKTFGAGHFAFQQHDPGSKVHIRKVEVMPLED